MAEDSDPMRSARERQHERTEHVEHILDRARLDLGELSYPVRGEDLAVEYGDQEIDLPNETESLGSVFDRLVGEQYESPEEVREAVYGEVTGGAGSDAEYGDQRDVDELAREEQGDVADRDGLDPEDGP